MEILASAKEFLQVENEDFDSEPNIRVIRRTVNDSGEQEFEISGHFPDELRKDCRFPPPKRCVSVNRSSALFDEISKVFEDFLDNIEVKDAIIRSIRFSKTHRWSYYSPKEADCEFAIGIQKQEVPSNVKEDLRGLILDEIHKFDESISAENIHNIKYIFRDFKRNSNHVANSEVWTEYPHRYYKNISSIEEYADKSSDSADEKDRLMAQNEHKVTFFTSMLEDHEKNDVGDKIPPKHIRDPAESFMNDFMEKTVSTELETRFESESIAFGDLVHNWGGVNFRFSVPVTEGKFGVSR